MAKKRLPDLIRKKNKKWGIDKRFSYRSGAQIYNVN